MTKLATISVIYLLCSVNISAHPADPVSGCRDPDRDTCVDSSDLQLMNYILADDLANVSRVFSSSGGNKTVDSRGRNALYFSRSVRMTKYLLSKGMGNAQNVGVIYYPLVQAINCGCEELAQFYLSSCNDKTLKEHGISNLLVIASSMGMTEVVKMVLKRFSGDKLFHSTSGQRTALHHASYSNRVATIKVLIENKFDVNARDSEGLVPLSLVRSIDAAKLLVEAGANINSRTDRGDTPLMFALHYYEVAKYLISIGVNVHTRTDDGITALHIASVTGFEDIVSTLLSKKVDVNAVDYQGKTPLMNAVEKQKKRIVELLIDAGANKCIKDNKGKNALLLAKEKNNEEIAKLLTGCDC